MSFEACAGIVERGDPERFLAIMAGPVEARRILFPIIAFNVEVSRAPWVTQEPMIAEMRLQWWRDALEEIAEGRLVRAHEVTTPLAEVLTPKQARDLDRLVAERRWDIYADPFEDAAHFEEYLTATAANLLVTCAQALGDASAEVVRGFGWGVGLANWLRAVPELEARGKVPMVDGRPEAVRLLAERGIALIREARARRAAVSAKSSPAMLMGWKAEPVLQAAARHPEAVVQGALDPSPARAKLSLMVKSATARW
ncbi:squalene/phytoene synthase family protein [Cognatishimia sp. MH4019]|uniref:squalene/phytoene synthase family protein n=1 Tax=Cognatishimia sp. MH4019 TaxID=2854030 RepID=UPI001CD698C9|nr:squalene/phytoene synthase family protein [Cognatishimia sp. MH4019]